MVQNALEKRGVASELATYRTVGDRRLDQPLSAIGAKGLFTQELEADLIAGTVDCCVHSLKDLPTDMPRGLVVVATLERDDPRDALLVPRDSDAANLMALRSGARVGTSSLRRRAQLRALRGDVEVVDLRGNVPTRVRKVDEGQVDAAILAAAGLRRLDAADRIAAYLDAPTWLPAAGQGAIAIQIRADDERTRTLLASLNHRETWSDVAAERAFLAALEGGCQIPIGALVVRVRDLPPTLHGFVSDTEGARVLRGSRPLDPADPSRTGEALAAELLAQGAADILRDLREASTVPAPQPE
jgi:hydroxymethylbilane synthase